MAKSKLFQANAKIVDAVGIIGIVVLLMLIPLTVGLK